MEVKTLVVGELDTNCYILYNAVGGEAYVVDPGDEAERILHTLVELAVQVKGVILTHVHFDHILAVKAVCRETGALLLVGAGDKPALIDTHRSLFDYFGRQNAFYLQADRLLQEGDTLPLGDENLTVLETPGHTPGCICLDDGHILISGDTLFAQSVGRTDFPGGHGPTLMRSLARLMALEGDRTVYPGHGAPTTLGVERRCNPYITMKL